jgi:hypothetical protein
LQVVRNDALSDGPIIALIIFWSVTFNFWCHPAGAAGPWEGAFDVGAKSSFRIFGTHFTAEGTTGPFLDKCADGGSRGVKPDHDLLLLVF